MIHLPRKLNNLMASLVVGLAISTAALGEPLRDKRLDQRKMAALPPLDVLVVVDEHHPTAFDTFLDAEYAPLFSAAMQGAPDDPRVRTSTGSETASEAVGMWVLIGAVAFVGGMQHALREKEAVQKIAEPMRERLTSSHGVTTERVLLDALLAELQARSRFTIASHELLRHKVPALQRQRARPRPWDIEGWLEQRPAKPDEALLVVHLRHGLHPSLAGDWHIADAWLLRPARKEKVRLGRVDPRASLRDTVRNDRPLMVEDREADFAVTVAGVASPVPYAQLSRPPADWVATQVAAIEAEYDPMIERARDHGYRRHLRTLRNNELEQVRGPWPLVEQAEFMAAAWIEDQDQRYPKRVSAVRKDLARRIVDALCQDPSDAPLCAAGSPAH